MMSLLILCCRQVEKQTTKLLNVLQGHASWVLGVSFTNNGAKVATASLDKTVRIWNVLKGEAGVPGNSLVGSDQSTVLYTASVQICTCFIQLPFATT
jgi:WD40 repeat protein